MKWIVGLCIIVCGATLAWAEPRIVPYQQYVTVPVPGATAAYSVNNFYADASADGGIVTIFGKAPGQTNIIVITPAGVQTIEIVIPAPPPEAGMLPGSQVEAATGGNYEVRYSAQAKQLQNVLEYRRSEGDRSTRLQVQSVGFFTDRLGQGPVSFPTLSYQINTPGRDITLLDQTVVHSPLTVEGNIVRGLYWRERSLYMYGGYTSLATFQSLFLPTESEGVLGVAYRWKAGEKGHLTPSLFYFPNTRKDSVARSGALGSLLYEYKDEGRLRWMGEAGMSRKPGLSGEMDFHGERDRLAARFRYKPEGFSGLSAGSVSGLQSNFDWSRRALPNVTLLFRASADRYDTRSFEQRNLSTSYLAQVDFRRHWTVTAGFGGSDFAASRPVKETISTLNFPVSFGFNSSLAGATAQYQYSRDGDSNRAGHLTRLNLRGSRKGVVASAFVERQTQAPTLGFILAESPELQDALLRLGITATSTEQLAALLRQNAALANLGFTTNTGINISPERLQAGATLNWTSNRASRDLFTYNFLYNSTQGVSSSFQTAIHTFTYSRQLGRFMDVFVSAGLLRTRSGTRISDYDRSLELSLRRRLFTVPTFLIPGRYGSLTGMVFLDQESKYAAGANTPGLAGAEVVLNDDRRTKTDSKGLYRFDHVPFGSNVIQVEYKADRPYFYTTPSRVQVEANAKADFGVAYTLGQLNGYLRTDSGAGIGGATVQLKGVRVGQAQTADTGRFAIAGLPAGVYEVSVNPESMPSGYALDEIEGKTVTLAEGQPAQAELVVRAIRNLAGRVTIFDSPQAQPVGVPGARVEIRKLGLKTSTDSNGGYIFRDLPAGTVQVTATYNGKQYTEEVTIPATPYFRRDLDFSAGVRE